MEAAIIFTVMKKNVPHLLHEVKGYGSYKRLQQQFYMGSSHSISQEIENNQKCSSPFYITVQQHFSSNKCGKTPMKRKGKKRMGLKNVLHFGNQQFVPRQILQKKKRIQEKKNKFEKKETNKKPALMAEQTKGLNPIK